MTPHRTLPTVMRDVGWGLSKSMYLAGLFGTIAVAVRLLDPSYMHGVSLGRLIGDYVVLGVAGGVLTGIFRPLTRGLIGSAFVGALWGIVLALVVLLPIDRLDAPDLVFMLGGSIGGAVLGAQLRRTWWRIDEKRRSGML
jgi:hypothetical protein